MHLKEFCFIMELDKIASMRFSNTERDRSARSRDRPFNYLYQVPEISGILEIISSNEDHLHFQTFQKQTFVYRSAPSRHCIANF